MMMNTAAIGVAKYPTSSRCENDADPAHVLLSCRSFSQSVPAGLFLREGLGRYGQRAEHFIQVPVFHG